MIDSKQLFRIYLSHMIRGPKGLDATEKEIQENINIHIVIGTEIKAYLIDWEKMDGLPKTSLYVPAEHDEFVQLAYNKKYIDEAQILDIDCDIIDKCNLLVAFGNPNHSRGMQVEIQHAVDNEIPIYHMPSMSIVAIKSLNFAIKLILRGG